MKQDAERSISARLAALKEASETQTHSCEYCDNEARGQLVIFDPTENALAFP